MMRKQSFRIASLLSLGFALTSCTSFASNSGEIVHEQQWIVDSIGKDVSEMVLFAGEQQGTKDISPGKCLNRTNETAADGSKFSYELTCGDSLPKQTREFALESYVWSPDNYAPWAKQLIEAVQLHREDSKSATTDALVEKLSSMDVKTISDENNAVSAALSEHPMDPALHEEAALLCATFALRETASCFTDVRPWLNRISAHLAIARALLDKDKFDHAGQLASVVLACESDREAAAVAEIDSLKSEDASSPFQSWLRAVKIRATRDYRLADLKSASLLEKLEYGRAIADDIGSDYLTDFLERDKPAGAAIDWMRIGARGVESVESGHNYAEPGVTAELADFARDFQLYKGLRLDSWDALSTELSLRPTRCYIRDPKPQLKAISWSDVAAFHARHLLDSVFQRYHFEQAMWGVPDQAKGFIKESRRQFSKIRLFPLVELSVDWVDGKKTNAELANQLNTLISESPEDINSNLWHRVVTCSSDPKSVRPVYSWFVPRFPFGTAFDFSYRYFLGEDLSKEQLLALQQINPYHNQIIHGCITAKYPHDSYTTEQLAAEYGALGDYDIHTMLAIAERYKNDQALYAKQIEKLAQYKPDYWFKLGDTYLKMSQPGKAKEAFEMGVSRCRDSVMLANSCSWLVNYYYDHGQRDKAIALAKQAADVYSEIGLETAAKLYERMGNLTDSEDYFKKIAERYDDSAYLLQFYQRHQAQNQKYKTAFQSMIRAIFPGGLMKVDIAKLSGAPNTGVKLTTESDRTDKNGLHSGDIFVAINGYRVANESQYHFAADSKSGPEMEFVVWNGKEYKTIKANLPDHRLRCGIADYTKD